MDYNHLLSSLQTYFNSGRTRSLQSRLDALDQLNKLIQENKEKICQALFEDLHKPKQEALISEIAIVAEEIKITKRNLKKWVRPQCVKSPLALWPSKNRIY